MILPTRHTVQCISPAGLHTMAYSQWGDPTNPKVLVCVHGVTRVSDDFDDLARALCDTYRVICPDIVGRGRSGRLRNPMLYQIPQYVGDMVTLLARANADTVHWFGTSMGGLIGMMLASLDASPVRKLVLNDIGPTLNPEALTRIGDYIGEDVRFSTFEEAEQFIRTVAAPFGPHTDEQWRKLAGDVMKQDEEGKWVRHYDLNLAMPFKSSTPETSQHGEAMLWAAYEAIRCPTLLVRGAQSDLLSHETAKAMTERGPRATLVEIDGVGHAPTFMQPDQIAIARRFLLD